jgi:UPF0755 protein
MAINLAVGAGRQAVQQVYDGYGPLTQARDVIVPHGGLAEVAGALAQAGVIRHVWSFEAAALISGAFMTHGSVLHAAEFHFPAFASVRSVLAILREGKPAEHSVTIPEGLTAVQIASLLGRTDALSGDDALPSEGAVLPSTYSFTRGATRASIVQRAQAAMQHDLTSIWAARAPDLPLETPEQALVLASIVERETGRAEERPRIAAVFLNRLRLGMRLQSDPTVAYVASGRSGVLDHKLTRADLEQDSPYNTYRVHGLPPGPIDSPGLAALQAVTHPVQTSDLYFVADGSGGHAFARTLEEHQQNVARWRAAHQ